VVGDTFADMRSTRDTKKAVAIAEECYMECIRTHNQCSDAIASIMTLHFNAAEEHTDDLVSKSNART
jgi:hypothetical protein